MIKHSHCQFSCTHPQPVMLDDGREICGECWFLHGIETVMVPCTDDLCNREIEPTG